MEPALRIDKAARRLVQICSVVTASVAGLALLSWGLGEWRLGAFGADFVPMAPSTALAMLLLNSAVLLRHRWPEKPATTHCGSFVAATVALLGLLVLIQEPAGFELVVEKWLTSTTDTVAGIPVGRMSALTALTFLLAAGALGCRLPPWHDRRLFCHAGNLLSLLVWLTGLFVVLGYASETPLLYGGRTIPMALLTAVSFVLTGMALLAVGAASWLPQLLEGGWSAPASGAPRRFDWRPPLAFVVLAAAIATAGFFYLRRQQADTRLTMHDELTAIAELKVAQIVNWRTERLGDARFFSRAGFVAKDVEALWSDPNSPPARAETLAWLTLLKAGDRYERVTLFDAKLNPRLTVPARPEDSTREERALVEATFRTNTIVMSDLYRSDRDGEIYLDIIFPIFAPGAPSTTLDSPSAAANAPIAVILLRLDPHRFLYPLVQSWPTPSRTAETVLVRREGDEVVFLNELRHRTNTALNVRFPVSQPDLPAALILRGEDGFVEGLDYRKVPVLTAFRRIPDSPWLLGAKVDQEEIYAPLRRQALTVGGIVAALLLTVALGLGLVWRQRDTTFLRRELVLERERAALAERFAHLMQHANDIILLADTNWRIREANDRALECYGYSLAELQRLSLAELRAPEGRLEFPHQVEEFLARGSAVFETVHRRKDGSTFPVEVSARLVEIGGVRYKLGIVRDITQRRAHEREIERLNRLYATLSQVNQAIVRTQSRDELFQTICRVAIEFGGFRMAWIGWLDAETKAVEPVASAGDVEGYLSRDQINADDRSEGPNLTATAVRTGQSSVSNDYLQDARRKPWHDLAAAKAFLSAAAFPIRFREEICGALTLYAGERDFFQAEETELLSEVALDISFALDQFEKEEQRRRAEEALGRSEADLQLALEAARLGNWSWNIVTGETVWSARCKALYGLPPETAMTYERFLQAVHPEDRARIDAALRQAVESRADYDVEKRAVWPDGSVHWNATRGRVFCDAAGTPVRMAGVTLDITERKRAEEEIRRLNQTLEQRVRERTAELAAANKELESFAYSVSHDLRAPLRHIDGFCDLLQKHLGAGLDEQGQRYFATVSGAAKQMGMLIDDLLSFSRTGRTEMRQTEVPLSDLVQEVIRGLEHDAAGRNVEWKTGALPAVKADRALLRQVFVNLLANALKYTRPRNPARIEIGGEEQANDEVVIFVRDNGVGFDPAYAHKLFGVFQRLHRADEFEGTGIGLANVHRIVLRHGGRTWAEGKPGEGATFFFSLPKQQRD